MHTIDIYNANNKGRHMANETLTKPLESQMQGLPVPFSEEALHHAVLNLIVFQARITSYFVTEENATIVPWQILGLKNVEHVTDIFDPDLSGEDMGLTYDDVRETNFAKCVEEMYQYAYFGRLDTSADSLQYESLATWICCILSDMHKSEFITEWNAYGGDGDGAALCMEIAELANARRVLEGGENFFHFGSGATDHDCLTIRQFALLSGMEEMSVRAAANKTQKRANPLITFKDEQGHTRIAVEEAKKWLQAKGRYVQEERFYRSGDTDITKRRYASLEALEAAMNARLSFLVSNDKKREEMKEALGAVNIRIHAGMFGGNFFESESVNLRDHEVVSALALILDLPPEVLVLRAKEASLTEQLADVEKVLKSVTEK